MKSDDKDYRSFFDNKYIGNWDVPDDTTVTIARVEAGELHNPETHNIDKKPIIYFEGAEKGMVANKTNCKTIAAMYGTKVGQWAGKQITLYATTCEVGGETKPCIRVRPMVPEVKLEKTA